MRNFKTVQSPVGNLISLLLAVHTDVHVVGLIKNVFKVSQASFQHKCITLQIQTDKCHSIIIWALDQSFTTIVNYSILLMP